MYKNKRVKLIAAESMNGVIGTSAGKIPWQGLVSSDVSRFVALTTVSGENSVIMGRKTWDSIPLKFRPLPDRHNIIVTKDKQWMVDPAIQNRHAISVVYSVEEALEKTKTNTAWIAGGAQIYEQAMKYVDELHITKICGEFIGDVFFPRREQDKYLWVFLSQEVGDDLKDKIYSRYTVFLRKL